jgi:hypothetical protein
MDFLVIAEDIPYYQWQIELLIESFKIQGLQDKLIIYLVKTNESVDAIKININNHKNVFYHNSESLKTGTVNFDFHNCILDYKSKNEKTDFAIIDPDTFLKNFDYQVFDGNNILYQIDQASNKELELIFKISRSKYNFEFYQTSSVIYFNSTFDLNFFKSSFKVLEDLVRIAFFTNLFNEHYKPDIYLYKYAYLLIGMSYSVPIIPTYKLLNYVYEGYDQDVSFVSYKHDIKPYFYKKNYYHKDFKNLSLQYPDPFQNLLDLPDFTYCYFIKNIVSKYYI